MLELMEKKGQITIQFEQDLFDDEVEVYYGTTSDLSLVDKTRVGLFSKHSISFEKPKSSNRLYYLVKDDKNSYMVSNRKINLEGTFNTRDFGGYKGSDGRMIKWGIFYRSDALCNLSKKDEEILTGLGIKTIVDFRSEMEVSKDPDIIFDGASYINLAPHAELAQLAAGSITNDREKVEKLIKISETEEGRVKLHSRLNDMEIQMRELVSQQYSNEKYQKYLELLLNPSNTPIIHHCKGGKDRAGFGTVIVLMALGVEKEVIMRDYMLTKELMAARNERRMKEYEQYTDNEFVLAYLSSLMQAKKSYLEAAFDEITKISGDFDRYLKDCLNMDEQKISIIRENYLYEK